MISKKITQKSIGEAVGLQSNFFNDIIHDRQKCPSKYALKLEPLTGIPIKVWIDHESKGERLKAWEGFAKGVKA